MLANNPAVKGSDENAVFVTLNSPCWIHCWLSNGCGERERQPFAVHRVFLIELLLTANRLQCRPIYPGS